MLDRLADFADSAEYCARVVIGFYLWLLLGIAYSVTVVCRLRRLGEWISGLSQRLLDWAGAE